ncbi:uncharacterized protein RHO17_013502 [Thomomys bottae]
MRQVLPLIRFGAQAPSLQWTSGCPNPPVPAGGGDSTVSRALGETPSCRFREKSYFSWLDPKSGFALGLWPVQSPSVGTNSSDDHQLAVSVTSDKELIVRRWPFIH